MVAFSARHEFAASPATVAATMTDPDFVRTVFMAEHGGEGVEYVVCNDLPTLVWLANLAALELHVPQWQVGDDDEPLEADLLVFDLDPGPPATIIECCDVARREPAVHIR